MSCEMKSNMFLIVLAAACVGSCLANCKLEPEASAESYICEGISSLGDLDSVPESAQRITILNSVITTLPGNSFAKWAASLTYLNITRSHLAEIMPGAFAGLSKLQDLILDNNQLRIISAHWIQSLPGLKTLRIWKSHVKEIEPEVFQHLPHLELLDIAYNNIDNCITKEELGKLKNLKVFHVTDNPWPLRCRPSVIFHLENHHVNFIHNWRTTHLFIADCLEHELGALWDDNVLKQCVESHLNTPPSLNPLRRE